MPPLLVFHGQVRDYEFDQEMQQSQSEASQGVKTAADTKRSQLEQWSASAYGEVLSQPHQAVMHHMLLHCFALLCLLTMLPLQNSLFFRQHMCTTCKECHALRVVHALVSWRLCCPGLQRLDPHLRHPVVRGEHPALRPAAPLPGGAAQTQPEERAQAAEAAGLPLWLLR